MAYNTFAPIVTNNMVLFLDSVNRKSYPESGTTFYDISGFDNNFTMATTPTFDGVMVFDGGTVYGTLSYNENFDLSTTDFTLEGFFKSNSFSSEQSLISNDTYGVNFDWSLLIRDSTNLRFYSNGTSTFIDATVDLSTDTWYHYVVTGITSTDEITIYLNGVQVAQDTMSISNVSQSSITVGCYSWNNPNGFLNGYLSTIRLYRKALTLKEINQNYNSLKNRFI